MRHRTQSSYTIQILLLATILSEAYHSNLPSATFINFNTHTPEEILEVFNALNEKDIVVLIQSKNFRLDAFRIRVELFKRKIKVLEHPHLGTYD